MLIPEIILYNAIKGFFNMIRQDYIAATDKTQTILNDLFALDNNGAVLQLENINYAEQAITLFTRTDEHPRKCNAYIGYNQQRAFLPAVHILLPQEVPGRYNSIGLSEGEAVTEFYPSAAQPYEIITRDETYRATFDLLVTSDNTSDVLLIYYLLKTLFPYISDTFEILGLHNFRLTGMDVQLDSQYAPPNIFHRSLRTEFDYQSQTRVRNIRNFANNINFLLCTNIGNENTPPPNVPNAFVSNNFIINVNKNGALGTVGYVNFTNKLTNVTATTTLNFNGQPNQFNISANLVPAHYEVEINLQNFDTNFTGSIGDGQYVTFNFSNNGQYSFDKFFDLTKVKTPNIVIQLNFS